jgi:hypothetical protein
MTRSRVIGDPSGRDNRDSTLVWWIDDHIDGAEDFLEWSGTLERADAVRARLLGDGWIDVS